MPACAGRCSTWTRRCRCDTTIDACHSEYALFDATRPPAQGRLRNLRTAGAVRPISAVDGLPQQRESDEQYEACLADLYASRRAGLG
jgi:hypothetical protein